MSEKPEAQPQPNEDGAHGKDAGESGSKTPVTTSAQSTGGDVGAAEPVADAGEAPAGQHPTENRAPEPEAAPATPPDGQATLKTLLEILVQADHALRVEWKNSRPPPRWTQTGLFSSLTGGHDPGAASLFARMKVSKVHPAVSSRMARLLGLDPTELRLAHDVDHAADDEARVEARRRLDTYRAHYPTRARPFLGPLSLADWHTGGFSIGSIVTGARRRKREPYSAADLIAGSADPSDLRHLLSLDIDPRARVLTDKPLLLGDDERVEELLAGDLLVLGSPVVNLLSRELERHSCWWLGQSHEKVDTAVRAIYDFVCARGPDFEFRCDHLVDCKRHPEFKPLSAALFTDALHVGPIDGFLEKSEPLPASKDWLSYGVISLARHPFDDPEHQHGSGRVAVYVAGMTRAGTAAGLRLLSGEGDFPLQLARRPFGGIYRVKQSPHCPYELRLDTASVKWITPPYVGTTDAHAAALRSIDAPARAGQVMPGWPANNGEVADNSIRQARMEMHQQLFTALEKLEAFAAKSDDRTARDWPHHRRISKHRGLSRRAGIGRLIETLEARGRRPDDLAEATWHARRRWFE